LAHGRPAEGERLVRDRLPGRRKREGWQEGGRQGARRLREQVGRQVRGEVRDQARQHEREAGLLTPRPVLVGVDTGGTFTDLVAVVGRRLRVLKVRSTPRDPAAAVRAGLATLGGAARLHSGSPVATNALLERRGARVALLTTAGFEDVLEIGRQVRPSLYALEPRRPAPLVPRARRIGVRERVLVDGTVETPLRPREVARALAAVARSHATAVAVCLLHGYARPAHERRLGRALAGRGLHVTLSHRLLREYRQSAPR